MHPALDKVKYNFMPVRKITKSYRSLTGIHFAGGGERGIAFESSLERDLIILQRFDPDVESVEEQPVKIEYRTGDGRNTHYTPDLLVRFKDQTREPVLYEVKYASELKAKAGELKERFAAAKTFAQKRGWVFQVVTEHDIRTPRLENARFLLPFRKREASPGRAARVLGVLRENGLMTVSELLEKAWSDKKERAYGAYCLWHLLSCHLVGFDIDQSLTSDSLIQPRNMENFHVQRV